MFSHHHRPTCCYAQWIQEFCQSSLMGLLQRCAVWCIPAVMLAETNPTSVNGWVNGYAFILSFLAPLWTICKSCTLFLADCFRTKPHPSQAPLTLPSISAKKPPTPQLQSLGLLSARLGPVAFWVWVSSSSQRFLSWLNDFHSNQYLSCILHGRWSRLTRGKRSTNGPDFLSEFWTETYSCYLVDCCCCAVRLRISDLLICSLTCTFHRYMMGSSMVCSH